MTTLNDPAQAISTPDTLATDIHQQAGDPALEQLLKSSIADIEKEFQEASDAEPVEGEVAAEGEQSTAEGAAPAKTEAAPTKEEQAKTAAPDAGLERLVAREVEIRERERALEARERAIKDAEGKRDPGIDQILEGMRVDPETALKAAGVDVDQAVRLIIAKRLGEKAPAELKQAIKEAEFQRELNALKQHNARLAQMQQAQEVYTRVSSEARAYVTTGISKDVPELSDLAAASPDWVHEQILEEMTRDAQQRVAARDTSDSLLPYSEAAKRVAKRHAPLLTSRPKQAQTAETKTEQKPASTATTTTPPPNPKPATQPRPRAPWLLQDDQELLDAGIKAGVMEFRQSRASGKF